MTIKEAEQLLNELEIYFQDAVFDVMKSGIDILDDNLKDRIFGSGLDASGKEIGKYGRYYSTKYKSLWIPLRQKRGLQTSYVDLKFSGKLMESLESERQDDGYVYGFNSSEEYQKASFQEELQGPIKIGGKKRDIFSASKQEESLMTKEMEKQLLRDFDKIIGAFA